IVARSGNTFGYQLAVVVDDAAMGITQVVRGNDLVESTPRQILIQEALGFPRPSYWHLGLVLDEHGKRLAKRDQSVKIAQLMSQGVDVTGILLESLGWNFSGRESPWDQLQMALANGCLKTNLLAPDFLWKCDKLHKVV
ncbi:MAG: Glutamate--tRNA ligase, partial [Planctomycetota bacterium]